MKPFLLFVLLGVNVFCAAYTIHLTSKQARMKQDFAYVNSLRFGLFSMDTWKVHFEKIVSKSVTNLKLSPKDAAVIQAEVEKVIRLMITKADSILARKQKTLGSKVRKVAYQALVDVPQLMEKSPQFAKAVVSEITKPESLEQIRVLALSQLGRYAAETRNNDTIGPSLSEMLAKYNTRSIPEFNRIVGALIELLHDQVRFLVAFMMGSVVLVLLLWWRYRNQPDYHKSLFRMSTGLAVIVLLTSLSVPMLDVDARIKTIDLVLLGEPIHFSNQVLFYRSKSILQVVKILIVSGKGDTFIVGLLLLLFSVVFPLAKLTATMLYLSEKISYRHNKWVQFFAFKSGKWSMADVMVLAIFMAYIGFNSILNDQLKGLNVSSESWQMITTNETSLQPGFILFVTFVLFGLALSEILERMMSQDTEALGASQGR